MVDIRKFPKSKQFPFNRLKLEQPVLNQSDIAELVKMDEQSFFCKKCDSLAIDRKSMKCLLCGERVIDSLPDSNIKENLKIIDGGVK
jgi:hypothetical protein